MIELCRLLEPAFRVVHIHLMPFLGGIIEGEGGTLRLCEHIVFLQFDKWINLVLVCVLKAQNVAYSFQLQAITLNFEWWQGHGVLDLNPKGPRWLMCHFTTFSHAIVALFIVMIFFINFGENGEMNKVHGITTFIQYKHSIQKVWQDLFFCKEWVASFFARHKGRKNFYLDLCGQLLWNFLHMFS